MKIISIATQRVYDIDAKKGGENAMPCPECSLDRKHKKAKSFSWNTNKNTGYCQNCQVSFVPEKEKREKEYKLPEWKNITELSDGALSWFTGRGISQETIKSMRVYTSTSFMPQVEKEVRVICYPYFRGDVLVNVKYRDIDKNFRLESGAELIYWNHDCILTNESVVIVEGEMDLLACFEAGVKNVISVPNGASKGSAMDYIDNSIELFDKVKKVILCVDQDGPGLTLRNELSRRYGIERCYIVNLQDCKDANEYLLKYSGHELHNRINEAEPIPMSGIVSLKEIYADCRSLYLDGMKPGLKIGISEIDALVTWETKRLLIVTGIPTHGKSEAVDEIVTRLNVMHGWKAGYFSPENFPIKYHVRKFISRVSGKECSPQKLESEEFDFTYDYIEENIHFIYPEESHTIESILDRALFLVKRYGIKIFIIDPWNKIEHRRERGESETEYIGRVLDMLQVFAQKHDILMVLVAHPTKMKKDDRDQFIMPSMYDISGSSNFYAKADYGLIVYRDFNLGVVVWNFPKVKFKHLGDGGQSILKYNWINGRYEREGATFDQFNNKSYILEEKPSIALEQKTDESLKPNISFYETDKEEAIIPEDGDAPF